MPGIGTNDPAGAEATPGRKTIVTFDLDETVLMEPAFCVARGPGVQRIAPYHHSIIPDSSNVQEYASGWWGLRAVNADHYEQHETTVAAGHQLRLADVNTSSGSVVVAEKPTYRKPTELTAAQVFDGADTDLQSSGDWFFWLKRAAGATWKSSLVSPLPMPPLPPAPRNRSLTSHIALDRVMEAKATDVADQGYILRWALAGNPYSKPDWTWRFYFGGPLSSEGYGQFCVTFDGNGNAWLYEREDDPDAAPPVIRWIHRDTWRFAGRQDTVNVCHVMQITPHAGRYIEFRSHLEDRGTSTTSRGGARWMDDPQSLTTHLYTVPAAHMARRVWHLPRVTGDGRVHVDVRRDLSIQWQIARSFYPQTSGGVNSGWLVDQPFAFPWGLWTAAGGSSGTPIPLLQGIDGYVPNGTWLSLFLYDGVTGAELPKAGSAYTAHGGKGLVVPVIRFDSSDVYRSPYVRGYSVRRGPQTRVISPGQFEAHGTRGISITGPDNDPTHETARLQVEDFWGELPRFRNRGLFSVKVETDYEDPLTGTTQRTILFRGYGKPRAKPMPMPDREFPGQDWTEYEVECVGWWRRLQVQLFTWLPYFAADWTAPILINGAATGGYEPWKVTDVIRQCLRDAGWPESQIDVPDNPMRLWPSTAADDVTAALMPSPGTSIGEYIRQIAQQYLGAYLIADPNAGTAGMWRLRYQPTGGAPLWSFVANPSATGVAKAAHSLRSYADGTSPILKINGESTLRTWVEPPEANAVFVCAAGSILPGRQAGAQNNAWGINPKGIDWDLFGTTADPESPDYLAMLGFAPVIDCDTTSVQMGRYQSLWMAHRLYDQACHGRMMASFTGHLVLVQDPTDTMLAGKRRPLRYGDPVNLDLADGTGAQLYLVRSCNPDYDKETTGGDICQLAFYELQKLNPAEV